MKRYVTILLMAALVQWGHLTPVQGQGLSQSSDSIYTRFVGATSLEQLSRGESGHGTLLYYNDRAELTQPSLVVALRKAPGSKTAEARVFEAASGLNYVPVEINGEEVNLPGPQIPSIVITSLDGWWVQGENVSYNLDIQVNGPIWTMWGGGYDPKRGPFNWTALVGRGDPAANIMVRDPNHDGRPQWELRRLNNPVLAKKAYLHVNYAERKCNTAVRVDRGVSPLWPYVARAGGYEQAPGAFSPPIVLDWAKGRITHFSELVTVRNQNCTYAIYSIKDFDNRDPDKVNPLNFESPFAFYDLSGQGKGYPNLILRTERYPVDDPWSSSLDAEAQKGRMVPRDFITVRYTWRNAVGDWAWDYKIEVLGFNPYTFTTPIAGGLVRIDAPPYEQYPEWVISHSWPVVTFIDTEGTSYGSSEGIYDWSPREVGIGYLFGWSENSRRQAFSTISSGFRGEYRIEKDAPPKLYFSPIDGRLHLLGAEGGLWNMGVGLAMQTYNLGDGPYINAWERKRILIPGALAKESDSAQLFASAEAEEALYALSGYLIYSGPDGVELRRAPYQPSIFESTPPADPKGWQAFRERLAPYMANRPDPKDLKSWLHRFPGQSLTITEGKVLGVRALDGGFRFVLDLQPGFRVQGADLLELSNLKPGKYVVTYDGGLTVRSLTPPALLGSIRTDGATEFEPSPVRLVVRNGGLQDIPQATLELWAGPPQGPSKVVMTQTVQLLGQSSITTTLQWVPRYSGKWLLTPQVRRPDGQSTVFETIEVSARPMKGDRPESLLATTMSPTNLAFAVGGLMIVALLVVITLRRQWATQER